MKKTTNIKASSKVNSKNVKTKNSKNSNNKKVVKKKNVENKVNVLKNKTFKFGENKRNIYLSIFVIFMLAVLLIVSSYAWFSTALNVKINTFNMVVMRNSGLTISHNAITYSSYIDISRELLYDDLGDTYPNYKTMWNSNGLIPVSTNGNKNPNSHFFDVYTTSGVFYPNLRDNTTGTVTTALYDQSRPKKYAQFLAFDIFLKNDSGSPISDNLYFDAGTGVFLTDEVAENITEEMTGLVNSMRIGIVKVGSLPIDATPTEVQNITCNNDCKAVIFEPYSTNHTQMAIDNAAKYDIEVIDGQKFPTYANVNPVHRQFLSRTISGSPTLDTDNFKLQNTMVESDFDEPIFTVPYGYTKARIYVWIEGQDIDSLETMSTGTNVDVNINLVKDTKGYDEFNKE